MSDKPAAPRAKNEIIKENSRLLRGTIADGLADVATGAIAEDDTLLLKFHGSYMQDDRDVRAERSKKKLEKAYSFMIRLRIPGGLVAPAQWIALDNIATRFANGTLRMTTRETFQYHGVIKSNLRRTMQAIHAACLDTLAACGDVNRNVMSTANPYLSKAHHECFDLAKNLSERLLPKTGAYHEIWLDGDKFSDRAVKPETEPLYGPHYLPRKFKAVVALPPDNDVDIFAHCLGYIAIVEKGAIVGYNVTVGGGMGMTHGETDTFPRTADPLGSCTPDQALDVAKAVLTVQRDEGDRSVRKHARLKYTIERVGLAWFRSEVERRLGHALLPANGFAFDSTGDRLGWHGSADGTAHYGLFVENGRLGGAALAGLRAVAAAHRGEFILTANQNLIIAGVAAADQAGVAALLAEHGLENGASVLRQRAMACVALPTCGLALAESERYLPELVTALDAVMAEAGLASDEIVLRMTGCPNGCARPYLAEIACVGRGPGRYNLYLGGAFDGTRLNKLHRPNVDGGEIVALLAPLFHDYAAARRPGERFGDFVIRRGVVQATTEGNRFHHDLDPAIAPVQA